MSHCRLRKLLSMIQLVLRKLVLVASPSYGSICDKVITYPDIASSIPFLLECTAWHRHGIMVMPKKYCARVTNFFRDMHKLFMKRSHTALGLQHYAVTINDELSNPLDPQSQKIGCFVVVVYKIYAHPHGLAQHWAIALKEVPEAFAELMAFIKIVKEEGSFLLTQAESIAVSLVPHELTGTFPNLTNFGFSYT
jgi:hypothetical protein